MLTRRDIQINLLHKLNELCDKANVKYVLHGHGAFLAYSEEEIPTEKLDSLEVLMCQGDAEKIVDLLDDNNNIVGTIYKDTIVNLNEINNFN